MTNKNTGGPAFPCETPVAGGGTYYTSGLTIRDYFAGQALQGLLASDAQVPLPTIEEIAAHFAKIAFIYADAMIAQRERNKP